MRNGFTLVELSIVLVIIGLLIGGILVGQSLIDSARIQSFTRAISQYDAMVATFKSKLKCLPGDCTIFSPAGDKDGFLEDADSDNVNFTGEIANFWKHLSDAGFANNIPYSNDGSDGIQIGIDVPKIKLTKEIGLGAISGNGFGYNPSYIATQFLETDSSDIDDPQFAITVPEATATDRKLDDGLADSGTILAGGIEADDNTGCFTSLIVYDLNSTAESPCFLRIRIMSQVGQ